MYVDMFPPPVLDCTALPERVGHIRITVPERDFERDERVFAQVLRSVRITPWLNWWARLPGLPLMCNWEQRVPAHLAIVWVRLHAG